MSATQVIGFTVTAIAHGVVAVGVIMLLVLALGLLGTLRAHTTLLLWFIALETVICVVLFGIGIGAKVRRNDVDMAADGTWTELYQHDLATLGAVQDAFQCCGWHNVTDRATPPFPTDPTCHTNYPGYGGCNDTIYGYLLLTGSAPGSGEYGREVLRTFQSTYECCGWNSTDDAVFLPFYTQNYTTCVENLGAGVPTCVQQLDALWSDWYVAGWDTLILSLENQYHCCGFYTPTDRQRPTYYNSTCTVAKNYTQSCATAVDDDLDALLDKVSAGCITVAVLQLVAIMACAIFFKMTKSGVALKFGPVPEPDLAQQQQQSQQDEQQHAHDEEEQHGHDHNGLQNNNNNHNGGMIELDEKA